MKAAERKKRDLVIVSLLSRLTDFQLQSNLDQSFMDWCEDLREYLVEFNLEGGSDEEK